MAQRGAAWRFAVDTSGVPANRPWSLSDDTAMAFRLLADSSCHILKTCKDQCEDARQNGRKAARQALLGVLTCELLPSGMPMALAQLHSHCTHLLAQEERPPGVEDAVRQQMSARMPAVVPSAAAASGAAVAPLDLTGWTAVDAMYSDEAFRVGCVLFTQFYRERTKELRLAFVCGFRDVLNEALALATSMSQGAPAISVHLLVHLVNHIEDEPASPELRKQEGLVPPPPVAHEDLFAHWDRGVVKREREGVMDTDEDARPSKRLRIFY